MANGFGGHRHGVTKNILEGVGGMVVGAALVVAAKALWRDRGALGAQPADEAEATPAPQAKKAPAAKRTRSSTAKKRSSTTSKSPKTSREA